MEKNGLEMHYQRHRFIFKKSGGSIPSHTLPSPARGFQRSVQAFGFQCPPPLKKSTPLGQALLSESIFLR